VLRRIPWFGQLSGCGAAGWTAPVVGQVTGHVFSEAADGYSAGTVPTQRGTIVMFDGATGRILHWTVGALSWNGASTWDGPPLVNEQASRHYVLDRDRGKLGVYDTRSGALVRIIAIGPGAQESSTGGIHLVFGPEDLHLDTVHGRVWLVNSLDSRMRMLDARRGVLLLTLATTDQYPPSQPGALVIDERNNRVYISLPPLHLLERQGGQYGGAIDQRLSAPPLVFHNSTRIDVRDATTGRLVGTVRVGVDPCSLAVDEPGHHVLAARVGGKEYMRAGWAWPSWARHMLPFLSATPPAQIRDVPANMAAIDEGSL
jgi:DNA-binding beta-propeller fold protein YncE